MRKFTKVSLIIAAICLIFGIGFAAFAAAMGVTVSDLPDMSLVDSRFDMRYMPDWKYEWDKAWYEFWNDWDESWNEGVQEFSEDVSEEALNLQWQFEESKLGMDEYWNDAIDIINTQSFTDVKDLDINVSAGGIQLISVIPASEKEKNQIQVNVGDGDGAYQMYMDDGKLHVEVRYRKGAVFRGKKGRTRKIQILIPIEYQFNNVDIAVKGGAINADQLLAGSLDVDMAAGGIDILNGKVEKLDGNIDVGSFTYRGTVSRKVEMSSRIGMVELNLTGNKTYYDYEISAAIGSINVDGDQYSGLSGKKISNAEAVGQMDLSSKLGSIQVIFDK